MALHFEKKINSCKNKITIRNFSDKKFRITLEAIDGLPIEKEDFHVTIDHGFWNFKLLCSEKLVKEIKDDDTLDGKLVNERSRHTKPN